MRRMPPTSIRAATSSRSRGVCADVVIRGDVVAWRLPSGKLHIGVVAAERSPDGTRPLVIHNIGYGTQEEDVLNAFAIIGHYRW